MLKISRFSVPRFVLVKVSVLLCLSYAFPQNNYKSYDDLAKQADKLFNNESYTEAKPLFSQLVSIKYSNPDFHYKYGTCILFADENKKKAIFHLQFAAKNSEVDPYVYYYLGKAYHSTYKFDKAFTNYEKFVTLVGEKGATKLGVRRDMEMCQNGKDLFRNQSEIVVLDKKEADNIGFYRYYDLSHIGGQILVKPPDFDLGQDKKRNHKTLIHFPKNSNVLYFSSYGDKGEFGKDIYQVTRGPDGKWGRPSPVLGEINTPYDEDYPFFHPDGKTLYFCSKGHNSMGGYDIFKSEFNPMTGSFGTPVNLDFAINTPDDDLFFISDSTNNIAYFASGRSSVSGKVNVYKIKVKKFPVQSIVAKGNFASKVHKNNKLANIIIEDVNTKLNIGNYTTDSLTGNYLLSFPKRGKYRLILDAAESDYTHVGIIEIPTERNLTSFVQELTIVEEEGKEKLMITNNFDKGVVGSEASEVYLKRADLEVNYNAFYDNMDEAIEDMDEEEKGPSSKEVNKRLDKIMLKSDTLNQNITLLNQVVNKSFAEASHRNEMAIQKAREAKELAYRLETITDQETKAKELLKVDRLKKESQIHSQEAATSYTLAKSFEREANKQKEELEKLKEEFKALSDSDLVLDQTPEPASDIQIKKIFSREVQLELEKRIESFEKSVERTKKGLKRVAEEKKNLRYEIASKKQELSATKRKKDKKKIEEEIALLERKLEDHEETIKIEKKDAKRAKENLQSAKWEKEFVGELKNELRNIGDYATMGEQEKLGLSKSMMATSEMEKSVKVSRAELQKAKEKYPNLYYGEGDEDLEAITTMDEAVEEDVLDEEIIIEEEIDDDEIEEKEPREDGMLEDKNRSENEGSQNMEMIDQSFSENSKNEIQINPQYKSAEIIGKKQDEKNNDNWNAKEENESPLSINNESVEGDNLSLNEPNSEEVPEKSEEIQNKETPKDESGQHLAVEDEVNKDDSVVQPLQEGTWYDEAVIEGKNEESVITPGENEAALGNWDNVDVNAWLSVYQNRKDSLQSIKLKKKEKQEERAILNEQYLDESDILLKRANIAYRATNSPVEKEKLAQEIQLLESFQVDATTELMAGNKKKSKRKNKKEKDALVGEQQLAQNINLSGKDSIDELSDLEQPSTDLNKAPGLKDSVDNFILNKTGDEILSDVPKDEENIENKPKSLLEDSTFVTEDKPIASSKDIGSMSKENEERVSITEKRESKEAPLLKEMHALEYKLDSITVLKDRVDSKKEKKKLEKEEEKLLVQHATKEVEIIKLDLDEKRSFIKEDETKIDVWKKEREQKVGKHKLTEEEAVNEETYKIEIAKNLDERGKLLDEVEKLTDKAGKAKSINEKQEILGELSQKLSKVDSLQKIVLQEAVKSDSINRLVTSLSPEQEVAEDKKANLAFNRVVENENSSEAPLSINKEKEERSAYVKNKEKSEEIKQNINDLETALKETKKKKKRKELENKLEVLRKQEAYFQSKLVVEEKSLANEERAGVVDSAVKQSFIKEINLEEGEEYTYEEIGVIKGFLKEKETIKKEQDLNIQKINALEIGGGNYLKKASSVLTALNELDKTKPNYETKKESLLIESRKWNEMAKINFAKSDSIKKINKSLNFELKEVEEEEAQYISKLDETRFKKVMEAIVSNNFVKEPAPEPVVEEEEKVDEQEIEEEILVEEYPVKENNQRVAKKEVVKTNLTDNKRSTEVNKSLNAGKKDSAKDNLAVKESAKISDYFPNDLRKLLTIPNRLEGEIFSSTNESVYSNDYPIPIDPELPNGVVFKVQIGAFRKPIPQDLFKEFAPVMGETSATGITRYTAGMFTNLETANEAKGKIRALGYSDAFVVSFYNGERISFNKAMAILRGEKVVVDNRTESSKNSGTGEINNGNRTSIKNYKNDDEGNQQSFSKGNSSAQKKSGLSQSSNSSSKASSVKTNNESSVNKQASVKRIENYDAYLANPQLKVLTKIENVKGLFYTVQIGAFSTPKNSNDLMGIKPLNTQYTRSGMICYSTGIFKNINIAEKRKQEIVDLGIKDAFVTAYYNGKRVVPQVALRMQQSKSNEIMATGYSKPLHEPVKKTTNVGVKKVYKPVNSSKSRSEILFQKYNYNSETDRIIFKVYIGSYASEIPVKDAAVMLKLMDQGIESEKKNTGITVYTSGNFSNFESAYDLQKLFIKEGLVNVKIISTLNDKELPVKEAIELLNK